ncbi:MAG: DUF1365 domain-containing protein [Chromatiales bacterium]|nr:DUF1365 domain-containing protein [Chromatiales bacterium]
MESCIYRGQVSHRRFGAASNRFRYPLFMLCLELGRAGDVLDPFWFWSARRPALAWLSRRDHHGDPEVPLDESIRELVADSTGNRPDGPVFLLTNLRYFGYVFNPLSVYYCHSADGELAAVVLEVSNLPWREMHCYVLADGRRLPNGILDFRWDKRFHVSPFMPMEMEYRCRLSPPGPHLRLALENRREGRKVFDAHLNLEREAITSAALARTLLRDPLITARVTTLIHWQAAKLWLKQATLHDHPRKA